MGFEEAAGQNSRECEQADMEEKVRCVAKIV